MDAAVQATRPLRSSHMALREDRPPSLTEDTSSAPLVEERGDDLVGPS